VLTVARGYGRQAVGLRRLTHDGVDIVRRQRGVGGRDHEQLGVLVREGALVWRSEVRLVGNRQLQLKHRNR